VKFFKPLNDKRKQNSHNFPKCEILKNQEIQKSKLVKIFWPVNKLFKLFILARVAPRQRKPKPSGLPTTSPSLDGSTRGASRDKTTSRKNQQRPLSEQLNQSLSISTNEPQKEPRRRQRSVDQSREM